MTTPAREVAMTDMDDKTALAVLDRYVTGEETDGYSAADLRKARAHLAAKLDAAEKLAEAVEIFRPELQLSHEPMGHMFEWMSPADSIIRAAEKIKERDARIYALRTALVTYKAT